MEVFNKTGSTPFRVDEVRSKVEIDESTIWNKISETRIFQFNSGVTKVIFCPVPPYSLLSLSGISGPWVDGNTKQHSRSFSKTSKSFSTAAFKRDGKLVALGNEGSVVDVYPTHDHQLLLRRFKLDSGTITSLCFSLTNNTLIVGCNNGKIHVLDIPLHKVITSFEAHSDSVTCIEPLGSGELYITGSISGIISIIDFKTYECVDTYRANGPISNMVVSSRRVFASSHETVIILDILEKLTQVAVFSHHTRPIIAMKIVRSNLVTASADRSVKIIDTGTFSLLHSFRLKNDISSFDVLPDTSAYAYGLASGGIVEVKYLSTDDSTKQNEYTNNMDMPANFHIFTQQTSDSQEIWNKRLRSYDFSDALDLTLKLYESATFDNNRNNDIEYRKIGEKYMDPKTSASIVVGMLDELDRMGGLEIAISGRDINTIQPLLNFLARNITYPQWSHILLKAVLVFEKIYRQAINDNPTFSQQFEELSDIVKKELEVQKRASELVGKIDYILN